MLGRCSQERRGKPSSDKTSTGGNLGINRICSEKLNETLVNCFCSLETGYRHGNVTFLSILEFHTIDSYSQVHAKNDDA